MYNLEIDFILGRGCNLNCIYCVEHHNDIKEKVVHPNLDKVFSFVDSIRKRNDIEHLWLSFYGGEPLLYFKEMKKIVEHLSEDPKISFSVASNGVLLSPDIVNIFNSYRIYPTISWDGKNTKRNRGYDVFESHEGELLSLDHLCINSVITEGDSLFQTLVSLDEFNKKYVEKHNYTINFNFNLAAHMQDDVYKEYSSDEFEEDLRQIFQYAEHYKKGMFRYFIQTLQDEIRTVLRGERMNQISSKCRSGELIPIDLAGNVYACQNGNKIVADTQNKLEDIIGKIHTANARPQYFSRCSECIYNGVTCYDALCALLNEDEYEHMCQRNTKFGETLLHVLETR